jgi:TrmH family RNA methyltransferase
MAVGKVPPDAVLEEIDSARLIVALDGLANAENTGVIIRNCAAFGVNAVIVGRNSCSPYLRRAVRNSMGAVFRIPVLHVGQLSTALQSLRSKGMRLIAAHPRGRTLISQANLDGRLCVVFGNEDEGVSQEVLSLDVETVSIPMMNQTDSLNVANASAVFLYELGRRIG